MTKPEGLEQHPERYMMSHNLPWRIVMGLCEIVDGLWFIFLGDWHHQKLALRWAMRWARRTQRIRNAHAKESQ